ncbi:hypothetical protein RJT34_05052 [Clitoria ternatea]|uniref:MADS-box domain-containing protein n=1 Tax=Clitoria ternatea TaxID=43366 RepID=A0AAN9K2N7_CLITE
MMVKKKSSSGRQRIPIEKIPIKSHLQVTFSKRRSGLFKKASELCTLCGVKIAIIVFSPADKAFSFGHPEVESIIDSYLSQNNNTHQQVVDHRDGDGDGEANVCNLNIQLTQILSQLEIEKKRGEELERVRKVRQRQSWWEIPIDELGFNELHHLMFSLEDLKNNVSKYAKVMLVEHNTTLTPHVTRPGPNGFGLSDDGFHNKRAHNICAHAHSSTVSNASYMSFWY